jgi:hypothetical protein
MFFVVGRMGDGYAVELLLLGISTVDYTCVVAYRGGEG